MLIETQVGCHLICSTLYTRLAGGHLQHQFMKHALVSCGIAKQKCPMLNNIMFSELSDTLLSSRIKIIFGILMMVHKHDSAYVCLKTEALNFCFMLINKRVSRVLFSYIGYSKYPLFFLCLCVNMAFARRRCLIQKKLAVFRGTMIWLCST